MKKILSKIFTRTVITFTLVGLQFFIIALQLTRLGTYYAQISIILSLFSFIVVCVLICKNMNPASKMAWIVPILMFPMFGGVFYLLYGRAYYSKEFKIRYAKAEYAVRNALGKENSAYCKLKKENEEIANHSYYMEKVSRTPIFTNTKAEYYGMGEEFFESLICQLKKAERFIFIEFFIIEEGHMWNSVLDILKQKVDDGVEVRLLYDDVGCIDRMSYKYNVSLNEMGIKTLVFNRVFPVFSTLFNYRDHRKIVVIDGKVGFTGGINLADEYINKAKDKPYWKDAAVMIEGEAVWSLTAMFLQMWNSTKHTENTYKKYKYNFEQEIYNDGYIQPYKDEPLDKELVGEYVYMNIINNAKKYVYFYTPYLIIDYELRTALVMAAKRGVDVRLVLPGVPDKKLVYALTQSYYPDLISNGVKIYQYKKGFIHSKCCLSDDEVATVGTINLDYRSLYHHFENGIYFYKSSVCSQLKEDMEKTFEESEFITMEWCKDKVLRYRLFWPILKLLSPMV